MKALDLPSFTGRRVIVQVDTINNPAYPDAEDTYIELEGKVVRADENGMVLDTKQKSEIVPVKFILDIDPVTRPPSRRLVRRWLREQTEAGVRQHLVDRHGYPFDLVSAKAMTADALLKMHNGINHSNLGHQHGVKPTRATRGDGLEIDDQTSEE